MNTFTTKTDVGLQESDFYSLHRFDNHSAWLDRELRAKRRVRGEHKGFGFPIQRAPAPPREERPFYVQEAGFTSGQLLNRKYEQLETSYKLEKVRTDPYHYPNQMRVEEKQHYEDRRARSQHIDPTRRKELPRDMVLKEAVPEEMIQNTLMANYKDMKYQIDQDILNILVDKNVRPEPATIKELNVDLSCVDLPAREKRGEESAAAAAQAASKSTKGAGKDWTWCLGGRKPFVPPDFFDTNLNRSQSLGSTLAGRSMLSHQIGVQPGPFYGSTHDMKDSNTRIRGGRNAELGVAGTFPANELRPGYK
jgi:ribosomal protein L12E/L44/L45/RPP1/RPP2